ncbi:MAG: sugar ABC transporter ATP-binding protein [Bifidobacteriaceae bacterium]|jgi:putative multiple sugar transport system ATP-binding protein|nr:sugar ABC transporter ATP-binding protein [Bifidobacteriaceae bacterium]
MADSQTILEMRGIGKSFPGVRALDDVSMMVRRGEIHAICGENGAGKSTLMKVLSGVHPRGTYEGVIVYQDEEVGFKGIKSSEDVGIVIIHQELALIPELSIIENVFMGNESTRLGLIDWTTQELHARDLLARVGLDVDPHTQIKNLGVGQQQLVEIAKALSKNVKLLILDEPTSGLNEDDADNLLGLLRGLKSKGITSIMISHKLNEIAAIADSVTVLRDGKTVESYSVEAGKVDEDRIIRAMVGRSIEDRYPAHESHIGDVVMEVRNWRVEDPNVPGRLVCKDSSFFLRAGEVVGFAGVMGAGRTELARSLFGRNYGVHLGGEVLIKGKPVELTTVSRAVNHGLAYLPEERKTYGMNLLDTVRKTIVAADLKSILSGGLLDLDREQMVAEEYRRSVGIRTPSVDAGVSTLSGGNQQKVLVAKWMFPNPDILILDEPTRGIDVGAKVEIYTLVHQLAAQGKAVMFISSELPELLGVCDRIYTVCEGRITGVLDVADATQEKLMRQMTTLSQPANH